MVNYRQINYEVMLDTKHQYETDSELRDAVYNSKNSQYIVLQEDNIDHPKVAGSSTEYIVSGKRSFEAAKGYPGKKVAVLNFANNHSVGGAPFSAGAQEESLCRCSTLYACLEAMKSMFHDKHAKQYMKGEIDYMGNDDLIYTPDVVVFKTDERTEPIYPKMMPREEWYKVDVITSAAPELWHGNRMPANYEEVISSRIKKILDVAAKENVQVLILGAWGCGAFKNPIDVVARVFHSLLSNYSFEIVEFALASKDDVSNSIFAKEFVSRPIINDSVKEKIESLLNSTGRENIEKVINWLNTHNFYTVPASIMHHNNFEGGLAKHSLEVCEEAIKRNESLNLPLSSVIICSLLHDVCKHDNYFVDNKGKLFANEVKKKKGHGLRSMYIVKRGCQLPLNYDEEMAIWWHMGEHEESKDRFLDKYVESKDIPLCRLIQKADGTASHKTSNVNRSEFEYNREYTPNNITSLKENEIFVFGSNIRGRHVGGAAYCAQTHFGAEWGVGEGLTGKCYALPTMEGGVDYIGEKVQTFISCAKEHPELKFYVTPVACGIAGFKIEEIAPLFKDAITLQNVTLPKSFVEILEGQRQS